MHARSAPLAGFVVALTALAPTTFGETVAAFDGGPDSTVTLQTFHNPSGVSLQPAGGNPDGFLRLTDSVDQRNYATFNRTDAGTYSTSTFSFQFSLDAPDLAGADGFSFAYYPTAAYGTSGGLAAAPFLQAEEPAAAGALAFAFDTYNNGSPTDDGNPGFFAFDYSDIGVFYNGIQIARTGDTRFLSPLLDIADGFWHTVTGSVDFTGATASLSVDGTAYFVTLPLPGLVPIETRVGFAARTAGAYEHADIDNVSVQFVPEPAAATLLLLFALARRRRQG